MKKYIVMFGLTLVMFVFVANTLKSQNLWDPVNSTTTIGKIGVGTTNPAADFHIFREGAITDFRMERPNFLGTGAIGRFRIQSGRAPDVAGEEELGYVLNLALRRWPSTGQVEMVNSVYNPNLDQWLAFNYFNADTRRFEMRSGVLDAVFLNSGDMLFNNGGGVGIDVDEIPEGFKFAVNGKVIAEELQIQLKGDWPDFVFADDYELMSLHEVENYIKLNRHLPNVPSEAQVLENGVNVGEMTSILLQKVEELTLHIIELNKRIEELEK